MNKLFVSYYVESCRSLGPGKRLAVYFYGCKKGCSHCQTPELQNGGDGEKREIAPEELAATLNKIMKRTGIKGISVSGGDPLEQDTEAMKLFLGLLESDDILLFTGYTYKEVCDNGLLDIVKDSVSVLKCGPYVHHLNDGHPLMGSKNQELIFLDKEKEGIYNAYIKSAKRRLEFFTDEYAEKIIYVGLMPKKEG